MHLPFWLSTLLLAPLVIWQGKQTRRYTPRLPEAGGSPQGQYGTGAPALRLLVLGESTAAGVGVSDHQQGLASQLARQLHQQSGTAIAWHSHGINGIRLAGLLAHLNTTNLPEADVILVSMGVNDTTGLTPRRRYREQLKALAHRQASPLYLLSVPPMHRFTALPSPLRQLLGWRARQLDAVQQQLARAHPDDFRYLAYPAMTGPELLAEDGYHPGPKGYQAMASSLVSPLSERLPVSTPHQSSTGPGAEVVRP